jgi:capsid portal protein
MKKRRSKARIISAGGHNGLVISIDQLINKNYSCNPHNLKKLQIRGYRTLVKSVKGDINAARINPPYDMGKLLDLMLIDEYHEGCVGTIADNVIKQFECDNGKVMDWWNALQTPPKTNKIKILRQFVKYHEACGNGFMIKNRNALGAWVGLERLLPNETAILDVRDDFGWLTPDYVQYRRYQGVFIPGNDVIHMMKETHKSEAWGLASLPVAANVEILKEIKTLDRNNFKNGLFVDYLILVEGLLDDDADEDGDEATDDSSFALLQQQFETAIHNKKQHSSVIFETGDPEVKVRVEPLRKPLTGDGQKDLEEKYKSGIFAYHRVPPRLASQETPGKLGGDNDSDLKIFYYNKVKLLQYDVATILANELNREYEYGITADDFNFGNLLDDFKTEEERFFDKARSK